MSKKDYGTKMAESLRQAKQLGAQPATPAAAPTPAAKPADKQPRQPQSAPTTRSTPASPSPQPHPARVWPD